MSTEDWRLEPKLEQKSFLRRYGPGAAVAVVLLTGIVAFAIMMTNKKPAPRRAPEISMVRLLPPPPPAPTPPPVQQPPEQKIEKEEEMLPEEKPLDLPPETPDEPPVGTDIKGDGRQDGFGLSGRGGTGLGRQGGSGSRYGAYASKMQSRISEALRNNSRTRNASLSVQVRVWPDTTGRIIRAQLAGSTGDPALDATIKNEVLTGLQLSEPPPDDMPTPINLRLTARRP